MRDGSLLLALGAAGLLAAASLRRGSRSVGTLVRVRGARAGASKSDVYDDVMDRAFWSRSAGQDRWLETILAAAYFLGYENPVEQRLGMGHFGCVFALPGRPNRVLKLTGDPSDAAAWAAVLRDGPHPGIARLDMVVALPQHFDEWVVPLNTGNKRLYGVVLEHMEGIPRERSRIIDETMAETEPRWRAKARERIQHQDPATSAQLARLEAADRWLKERGVVVHDFRHDNAMQDTAGRWKLTDLGMAEAPEVAIPLATKAMFEGLVR